MSTPYSTVDRLLHYLAFSHLGLQGMTRLSEHLGIEASKPAIAAAASVFRLPSTPRKDGMQLYPA